MTPENEKITTFNADGTVIVSDAEMPSALESGQAPQSQEEHPTVALTQAPSGEDSLAGGSNPGEPAPTADATEPPAADPIPEPAPVHGEEA